MFFSNWVRGPYGLGTQASEHETFSTTTLANFCDEHHQHEENKNIDISTYLSVLGSLLYASTRTSSDIATAVNILFTRLDKSTAFIMRSENRFIFYLNNTGTYGI